MIYSTNMNILYRYLSSEAIENCVTCLNFEFDKVVFFGYRSIIKEEQKNISSFLNEKCGVKTSFVEIKDNNLEKIISLVNKHIYSKNNNYFDMTGNDGILSVAMSKIAYSRNIPMHIYDIWNNVVFNIDEDIKGSIFDVKKTSKKVSKLNIDEYIKMVGGTVCNNMNKPEKDSDNYGTYLSFSRVKDLLGNKWSYLSAALQKCKASENSELHVFSKNRQELLDNANNKITDDELLGMLDVLFDNNLILELRTRNNGISFTYVNEYAKKSMLETGSIFEQEVYKIEKETADDCKIGIHLDWDDIKSNSGVINEIDVLKLDGYVLTFISCKDTDELKNKALYELETVTRRFGGKYSKMKLACRCDITNSFKKRAESIGIELVQMNQPYL